ncbi:MAG TPA: DNA-processing protein DprA [Alphaproteobacteria bacterium]|nr:DNA-processing protein DprA [Alphaproteobacteria bacterium]
MNDAVRNNQTAFTLAEKLDWLRLFRTDNIGPITFYKLIERYGSAAEALNALPHLSKKGGRSKPLEAPPLSAIEKEYDALQKLGGDIICAGEKLYPLALAATDDAPPVLSYIGHIDLARSPCMAMVGARNASLNGKKFAVKLAKDLGQAGQVIVSGLARGIDTGAHQGALETGTIAVVAGGIDVVYPRENQELYEQICQRGLVLAESPLGMEPIARHFPKRNRIVSGLSVGVVVVEATLKSGSLITARMAGEQGRDVYAVPGYPLDPRAQGPNKLIQDGAVLVQSAQDILQAMENYTGGSAMHDIAVQSTPSFGFMASPPDEKEVEEVQILLKENLSQMPVGVDELARACHMSIPALQMALLEMELAGRLQRLPGNRVVLID